MAFISRRRTREFLLQSLYGRIFLGSTFRRDIFLSEYFQAGDIWIIDIPFADAVEYGILEKQAIIWAIIEQLAPKFQIETMAIINLLPLYISLYELLFLTFDSIPAWVSINEAIELTKKFSDDSGRLFVNWVLSSCVEKQKINPKFLQEIEPSKFILFHDIPAYVSNIPSL